MTRGVTIEFVDLVKEYRGGQRAVDGISLNIGAGEFLTLLGPSGSGKSSTLMMIAGLVNPTSGSIRVGGLPLEGVPPERRNIGVVFQNYALFPHMKVAQNLAFPLQVRRMPRAEIERRVRDSLALVRLDNYEDRLPKELSGGQQQRIALARALIFRPAVVLMDEPLGALDRHLREEMQREIRAIHSRLGPTVVYVTHDQHEALALSDRVAIMAEGRIVQVDQPEVLYRRPKTRFAASFFGDCNFLPAEILYSYNGMGRARLVDGTEWVIAGEHARGSMILALRPEDIHVAEFRPVQDDRVIRMSATVQERTFLGDTVRAVVDTVSVQSLIVKLPASEGHQLTVGQQVTLWWRPTAPSVLEEQPEAHPHSKNEPSRWST